MPKIDVYNIEGKKVSNIELADSVFGIEPNEKIVHSVLVNYMANQRQGSIRAPQWFKGGIALGPKPRDYSYRVNKKERRLAVKSVLSSKVLENNLVVVDNMKFDEIKTKNMVSALNNLKVEGKTLIVLPEKNENVQKSARNIEGVKTSLVNTINVYDLLKYNKLILTVDAVKSLEEVYA